MTAFFLEAETIEDELRTLLGVADAEHPILLELQSLEDLPTAQATG
jgi:hypothetical protein